MNTLSGYALKRHMYYPDLILFLYSYHQTMEIFNEEAIWLKKKKQNKTKKKTSYPSRILVRELNVC